MEANRYQPKGARGLSTGAALVLNAGLIGALFFVAPNVAREGEKWMPVIDIRTPPPEPIDVKPLPQPKPEQARPIDDPVVLKPIIDVPRGPVLDSTDVIPDRPPATDIGTGTAITEITPADPPAPLPFVAAIASPRVEFQPPYPASELRINGEGKVVVRVRIGVDGRVSAVERIEASSDAFFESTRRHALSRWRFTPATRGGVPVESWKQLTVRFELER